MAITKIHAIKSTLGKALAYIENPDKTDGQMLVSGYNCEPQTASIDFEMTAVLAHKARNLKRKRSTNLAYHLIQSFSPEDAVTPEQAHELGKAIRLHRGQNAKAQPQRTSAAVLRSIFKASASLNAILLSI